MTTTPPKRMVHLDEARKRFPDLVARMAHWLEQSDPLADALVEATAGWPRGQLFRDMETALRNGVDTIEDCPEELRALIDHIEAVPTWVDRARIDRGGAFFLSTHVVGGLVLGARSLILGYAAPAGNKPLVMSGRLERGVNRRLAETSTFVFAVSQPGNLLPGGDGVVATVKVRLIHAHVRRMIREGGGWNDDWGTPINQHDMMGTVILFSLVLLEGVERLGLRPDTEEADDYLALWRYVGYLLGVEQELLPATRAEAERYKEFVDLTQGPPDDDARRLTSAFLAASLEGVTDAALRKRGRRAVAFGQVLARELLGDEMADALAIPKSPLRAALPFVRIAVKRLNALRRLEPGRASAARAGARYWAWVLENGPVGPVDLTLPERLMRSHLNAA